MRVISIIALAVLLSGCSDYHELDQRNVVESITVEEREDGCAVTAALAGKGGVVTGFGEALSDGIDALAGGLGGPAFFGQVSAVALHADSAHRIAEVADWALSDNGPPLDLKLFLFYGSHRGPLDFEMAEKLIGDGGGLVLAIADGKSPPVIMLTGDGGMQIASQ